MAGTDDSVDDDPLYVLTAALLTPARFPAVLGDDYPEACAALSLEPYDRGYGLVMGQDGEGARWTVVVDDVSLVAVAIASWDCGMEYDLSPGERTVVCALPGWPVALSVHAPGLPAPHDPAPEPGSEEDGDWPVLTPPDIESWGPAQRRLGADEIALQWASWRERLAGTPTAEPKPPDRMELPKPPDGAKPPSTGDKAARKSAARPGDTAKNTGEKPTPAGHPGIRRVLQELHGYLDKAPPLGRVRSSFAPGDARTLRADGPGWSFVARTDDMAFVLLDAEPGEVLPIGRGTELPALLTALDDMAVRPT
ncbi:hypothetical protein KQY30_01635 [Streptomyces sp. GMY02]|uniref:hypothetical protein n=1 Tax=Streptomyces sp. GMY02 TaxID=1333528 RepID=UPI001C2BC681|nr:hypothetical protein [Streptomyces sp. GMY02]QXE33193.1 hypothetical protein KQY30_01635 [Streptomyces sp. GMY02]